MTDPVDKFARQRGYTIVGDDVASRADIVVCGAPGPGNLPGAVPAECADCSAPIVHSPYAPAARKVCKPCGFAALAEAVAHGKTPEMVTCRRMATEAMLHRTTSKGRG